MIKNMVLELSVGLMVGNMLGNGIEENSMELVSILQQLDKVEKVSGSMGKEFDGWMNDSHLLINTFIFLNCLRYIIKKSKGNQKYIGIYFIFSKLMLSQN